MSVRRNTTNRLTIFRECVTCGQRIVTTAETPWVRQMPFQGKKQAICYFCSSECFQASYKHIGWYDGKAEERRRQKDANRSPEQRAKQWQRYYAEHGAEVRAHRMERYWKNHDEELDSNRYHREKRKLLKGEEHGD